MLFTFRQDSACQLIYFITAGFCFLGYIFQTNPPCFLFYFIYFDFVFKGKLGRKISVHKSHLETYRGLPAFYLYPQTCCAAVSTRLATSLSCGRCHGALTTHTCTGVTQTNRHACPASHTCVHISLHSHPHSLHIDTYTHILSLTYLSYSCTYNHTCTLTHIHQYIYLHTCTHTCMQMHTDTHLMFHSHTHTQLMQPCTSQLRQCRCRVFLHLPSTCIRVPHQVQGKCFLKETNQTLETGRGKF